VVDLGQSCGQALPARLRTGGTVFAATAQLGAEVAQQLANRLILIRPRAPAVGIGLFRKLERYGLPATPDFARAQVCPGG
jgi:hypothetical protein